VVDNYATHKHPKVKRWLAARPRYHVHYTPTSASWINQVDIWFNIITQRAIRRGTFKSVKELVSKIDQFVQHYNATTRPFAWTATADSILEKIKRLCQFISGTKQFRIYKHPLTPSPYFVFDTRTNYYLSIQLPIPLGITPPRNVSHRFILKNTANNSELAIEGAAISPRTKEAALVIVIAAKRREPLCSR
jgi:hypothetical protein